MLLKAKCGFYKGCGDQYLFKLLLGPLQIFLQRDASGLRQKCLKGGGGIKIQSRISTSMLSLITRLRSAQSRDLAYIFVSEERELY